MRCTPFFFVIAAVVAVAGCPDTEFVSFERPPPALRPVGEACTVDSQCDGGRCIGGVCSDSGCNNDGECRDNEICVLGGCENADDFACQTDQRPILTINRTRVEFAQVSLGQTHDEIVTIGNDGDCLLTVQVVSLSQNASPDFSCDPCSAASFPQRVPPRRSLDVTVTYAPTRTGTAAGDLLVRADDRTAGNDGLVNVELFAAYDGIPSIVVNPLELSYGFVPFQQGGGGSSRTETITVQNQGTGSAALELQRLFLAQSETFRITAIRQGSEPLTLSAITPENPLFIPPFSPDNPLAVVEVDVTFTPNRNANFNDELVFRPGGFAEEQRVAVALSGSSLGPPQIEVSVAELVYGSAGNGAKEIGSIDFLPVTIRNNGQSELSVTLALGGGTAAGEFTVSPPFLPPVQAGGAVVVNVFFNPSDASDPANRFSPTRPFEAALNITSNDTDPITDVLKTVALRGFARDAIQDQVLRVEMEFTNADNSWAGNDFRNVDMAIEALTQSLTCTKPRFVPNNPGDPNSAGFLQDACAEWNSFGQLGQVSWIGLGAFEEPERVVVRGLGPTGGQGERFEISVDYIEDCANIPSALLANLLGIGASVLGGILGGAIGVPIAIPPQQVSNLIANNCFDHEATNVTTRIALNGAVVASPTVRLNSKGDRRVVATMRRVNGAFCSETAGVGGPDLQCQ